MNIICNECGLPLEVDARQLGSEINLRVNPCDCQEVCNALTCKDLEDSGDKLKIAQDKYVEIVEGMEKLLYGKSE